MVLTRILVVLRRNLKVSKKARMVLNQTHRYPIPNPDGTLGDLEFKHPTPNLEGGLGLESA